VDPLERSTAGNRFGTSASARNSLTRVPTSDRFTRLRRPGSRVTRLISSSWGSHVTSAKRSSRKACRIAAGGPDGEINAARRMFVSRTTRTGYLRRRLDPRSLRTRAIDSSTSACSRA
jgi:hypothetical protein